MSPKQSNQPASMPAQASTNPKLVTYVPLARALHWIMAALVLIQVAGGLVMTVDRPENSFWAKLFDRMSVYDNHKLLGLILLLLIVVRLARRLISGAPEADQQLATWQREASHMVHAWLYFLLIAVPLLGWIGISLYPALVVYGWLPLTALLPPDQKASAAVFIFHKYGAFLLLALIGVHIGAAIFHHFILRDGTLRRMLPGLRPPGS
jgi:cytochrome b561